MDINTQPKYNIGDVVKHPDNLYGEKSGKITAFTKYFQAIDPFTGKFDPEGLCISEDTITSTVLPYRFDGGKLEIDFPETTSHFEPQFTQHAHTRIYMLAGYNYTVSTKKMNSQFSEKQLVIWKSYGNLKEFPIEVTNTASGVTFEGVVKAINMTAALNAAYNRFPKPLYKNHALL